MREKNGGERMRMNFDLDLFKRFDQNRLSERRRTAREKGGKSFLFLILRK